MTLFSAFAFPATGGTASRTMPDRLADWKNVKDFGAVGDGSTDDSAAIQAAVDWTGGANRGTIYFPASSGNYIVLSPITLNYDGALNICFRGEGLASRIAGNTSGFVFTRTLASPSNTADIVFDRMYVTNSHNTGGCFRIGSAQKVAFRDGNFSAHITYTAENTDGGLASTNTLFSQCILNGGGQTSGRRGIIMAGGCIEGTDVRGYEVGYRIAGSGTTIWGGRSERCDTSMEIGVGTASEARGSATNIGAQGVAIIGHTYEGNLVSIHVYGTTKGFVGSAIYMLGHTAASGNAGVAGNVADTETGVLIEADCIKGGVLGPLTINSTHTNAGIEIVDPTTRNNLVFVGITGVPAAGSILGAGDPWIHSSKAMAASYIQCSERPVFTYANLPGASDRLEGDEYDISDSNTAVWGATAAAGGSNRVKVRFNGTNWTVMGS